MFTEGRDTTIDSELVFVGDAGTTTAGRPSRRRGIEWSNLYKPYPWLALDADLTLSHARFTNDDPAGSRIPGAVENTAAIGATLTPAKRWSASVRGRYFGPRALIEDNSVRSPSSLLFNAETAYRINARWRVALGVFNIFNRKASDIDYFYTSRLPGESASGVNDIHTHPAEPRSVRVTTTIHF